MAKGPTGRSGGFGAAVASVARDIGRALGFDRGSASGAGGTVGSIGRDIAAARSGQSMVGRADRDGPDRSERQVAAPAPVPVPLPVQPGATGAAGAGTPTPPSAPAPVVPGDMGSTGAAEDAALASAQKGRAATIATGAQGLLAEDADQLRRRRSLVGGGLIQ